MEEVEEVDDVEEEVEDVEEEVEDEEEEVEGERNVFIDFFQAPTASSSGTTTATSLSSVESP